MFVSVVNPFNLVHASLGLWYKCVYCGLISGVNKFHYGFICLMGIESCACLLLTI